MTNQEAEAKISRIGFGKLTHAEKLKITPCIRGHIGALLLEQCDFEKGFVDDVALVFSDMEEIDAIIAKLYSLKHLMATAVSKK
jgi:hypothetical protein